MSGRRPTSGVVIERKRTLTVATVNGVGRPTAGVGVAAVATRGNFGRLREFGASTINSTSDRGGLKIIEKFRAHGRGTIFNFCTRILACFRARGLYKSLNHRRRFGGFREKRKFRYQTHRPNLGTFKGQLYLIRKYITAFIRKPYS